MRRIIANQPARIGAWIQAHEGGYYREGTTCIGLEKDGTLIAGVMYDYYNGSSVWMHVAAAVRNWLDRDYLRVCFDYPFNQLCCKVILGYVAASNLKARRFDEHLGFKLTAVIPEGHPDGDLLIYAMRKEKCRWLENRRGKTLSPACA